MELKEALELTIKLWDFLAEDPNNRKRDHPDYKEVYYGLFSTCPLCEYSSKGATTADCDICPISMAGIACDNDLSLFKTWKYMHQTDREAMGAAKGIADLCRKALSELNQEPT